VLSIAECEYSAEGICNMPKSYCILCVLLCVTQPSLYAADKKKSDSEEKREKKLRAKTLMTPAITMLVDIPEDGESGVTPPPDGSPVESDIPSPSVWSPDTKTPKNFESRLEARTASVDDKEESALDPLRQITLPNGLTARCVLNAVCTAHVKDIEQKLQECRNYIPYIQDKNPETLDLFVDELKNVRLHIIRRIALSLDYRLRQDDEMVGVLAVVLSPRSELTEAEHKEIRSKVYQLLEAHRLRQRHRLIGAEHCPGCCGGCNIL